MRDFQTKINLGGVPDSNTSTKMGGGESTSLRTENKNAVSRSSQTLAPQDGTGEKTDQLAKALLINGVAGQSMVDGGSAGAYQLTPVTGSAGLVIPDLYAHLSGAIFEFEASNVNIGASTLDVGQTAGTLLGAKDLTLAGGVALSGGEMVGRIRVLFDLANDRFELLTLPPDKVPSLDGVAFPATAVPSADPNTLDDYEEGAWTPGIAFGGASVGITYAVQVGNYTKVGNLVNASCNVELTSKGSSVGSAFITNLPFPSLNSPDTLTPASLRPGILTFADMLLGHNGTNTNTIALQEITTGGSLTTIVETNFADTTTLACSVTYSS